MGRGWIELGVGRCRMVRGKKIGLLGVIGDFDKYGR